MADARKRRQKENKRKRVREERKGEPGYDSDGYSIDFEDSEDDIDAENTGDSKVKNPIKKEEGGDVDLDQFERDDEGNYNFDGYDTDEMRELLQSLRSGNKPKRKRRKLDVEPNAKRVAKTLRAVIPDEEQKEMENKKKQWFKGGQDENWDNI